RNPGVESVRIIPAYRSAHAGYSVLASHSVVLCGPGRQAIERRRVEGQRWGAENLGRPIGSGRPSRLRLLLAFAATLAAAALLGCDKKIPNPSGRHMQPLSQEILAELDGKGMTREAPILIRIFRE